MGMIRELSDLEGGIEPSNEMGCVILPPASMGDVKEKDVGVEVVVGKGVELYCAAKWVFEVLKWAMKSVSLGCDVPILRYWRLSNKPVRTLLKVIGVIYNKENRSTWIFLQSNQKHQFLGLRDMSKILVFPHVDMHVGGYRLLFCSVLHYSKNSCINGYYLSRWCWDWRTWDEIWGGKESKNNCFWNGNQIFEIFMSCTDLPKGHTRLGLAGHVCCSVQKFSFGREAYQPVKAELSALPGCLGW